MIDKFAKNIVKLLGIIFCLTIFVLNIVNVSRIEDVSEEIVTTKVYGFYNILITGLLVVAILIISKKIEQIKLSTKLNIIIIVIFIIIYCIAQIYWINIRQATPIWDQDSVYSVAVEMYKKNWEELKNSKYLEMCPQQITLSIAFWGIFNIFGSTSVKIIQYANIFSNVATILGIILIVKNLEEQYKVCTPKALILTGTFFTLPLLSTFVYGDLISIPMCLFSIYFIMKYEMKQKKNYAIFSAISMAMAYILRMNNLIFVIAIVIYLILNIINGCEDNKNIKTILAKISVLIVFIIIAIAPAVVLKNTIISKLHLDKNKKIPTSAYLYMGMQESYRANGWYSDYIAWAWNDVELSKEQYKKAIKERIKHFIQSPDYCIRFYIEKIASMWTENTYASLWYNQTFNFKKIEGKSNIINAEKIDELVIHNTERLQIYQKALIIIIFGTTILVIIKQRNKLSNEIILLITIFIGGFLFHILWEAKSRYIIPYIIVLIPVSSVNINSWK